MKLRTSFALATLLCAQHAFADVHSGISCVFSDGVETLIPNLIISNSVVAADSVDTGKFEVDAVVPPFTYNQILVRFMTTGHMTKLFEGRLMWPVEAFTITDPATGNTGVLSCR